MENASNEQGFEAKAREEYLGAIRYNIRRIYGEWDKDGDFPESEGCALCVSGFGYDMDEMCFETSGFSPDEIRVKGDGSVCVTSVNDESRREIPSEGLSLKCIASLLRLVRTIIFDMSRNK